MTEFVLQTPLGRVVERSLYGRNEDLHAPYLLDVEVLSALRRLVDSGAVPPDRAEDAIQDFALLRITRHSHVDFLTRVWELRQNLSAYDAIYVAVAESLDATLVTCDRALEGAPGHSARIEVIRAARGDRDSRV